MNNKNQRRRMKHLILISILLLTTWSISAQTYSSLRPQWTKTTPNPPANANYFLSWGVGEGKNEAEANNIAWADALQKSLHELGAIGITQQDIDAVKIKGIDAVISFNKMKRRSLCQTEFIKKPDCTGGKVYVLIQVQKSVHGNDDFYDVDTRICNDPDFEKNLYKYISANIKQDSYGRAFVPGMAQLYYSQNAKAGIIIGSEAVFVAGIVVGEVLRSQNDAKINSTHNTAQKQDYIQKAQRFEVIRNISIGGAIAVYAWNVIDGMVQVSKHRKQNNQCSILPYALPDGGGLTLTITF
jgi:hypothetical protein